MDNTIWADIDSLGVEARKPEPDRRSVLDKDAFLRLLLTELKYQDPLNPTDDKAFIAQMAQFSSLEQMKNMSKALSLSQGCSMIGRRISAQSENKNVNGVAEAVVIRNDVPYIRVGADEAPLDSVTLIHSAE
jgi:flagellar basal-body rod modification protein FlgD